MKTTPHTLHIQGNDWKRDLEFYVDELAILTRRLDDLNRKKPGAKTIVSANKFLKKLVTIRKKTDALKVALDKREKKVETFIKLHPLKIDTRLQPENDKLFSRVSDLAQQVANTRYELNKFLVKTLLK